METKWEKKMLNPPRRKKNAKGTLVDAPEKSLILYFLLVFDESETGSVGNTLDRF